MPFRFFKSYISQRKQKAFVAGHYSPEGSCKIGVPQGPVLGPVLFSIYINDLPVSISSTEVDCDMFADDSSLSASGNDIAAINAKLQPSIQEVTEWCSANAMLLNPEKTKSMVVATRQKHQRGLPPLCLMLNSQVIEQVSQHRHLGVILDDQLKWQVHINSITNAVAKNFYLLSRLKHLCNSKACNTFFTLTLCPELMKSLMYGMAAVMYISKNLKLYTNVQPKLFMLLRWTRAHFICITFKRASSV